MNSLVIILVASLAPVALAAKAGLTRHKIRGDSHDIEHHDKVEHVKTIIITKHVKVPVPRPYPVHVEKRVPYEVMVPVEVEVPKPFTVEIPKPYAVYIEKKVPYTVEKKVPYPVKVEVKVPVPVNQHVHVPKSYPAQFRAPKPYEVTESHDVEKREPIYEMEHDWFDF